MAPPTSPPVPDGPPPQARSGSPRSLAAFADEEERRQAGIISEHLPAGYTAEFDGSPDPQSSSTHSTSASALSLVRGPSPVPNQDQQPGTPPYVGPSSLKLQGGDIHRALFKLDARASKPTLHKRAATFHVAPTADSGGEDSDEGLGDLAAPRGGDGFADRGQPFLTVGEHLAPNGFRRAFLRHKRQQALRNPRERNFIAARMPVTSHFVEFLDLYGSFAGEDLADSDDEEAILDHDEDGEGEEEDESSGESAQPPDERRPLIRPRSSSRYPASTATSGIMRTFFTLFKAFVGTGIMFLPNAFRNGGILFSTLTMLAISVLSMIAFHLLLQLKRRHGGGYGEIGQAIAGQHMRLLILGSITLSQLGFVCSGIIFAAENLTSVVRAWAAGRGGGGVGDEGRWLHALTSAAVLIALQLLVIIPMSFIRNIAKLGPAALLADVFIFLGIGYICWFALGTLAGPQGVHDTVVLFNPEAYTLTIGAAIFTFEGIGLILPIEGSMARPQHFEPLLAATMGLITLIFTAVGALGYATFGVDTKVEVIDNFPHGNGTQGRLVTLIQLAYSIAILIGVPVQLFPALRILEARLFGRRSGKKSALTKWTKNAFRAALVAVCGAVSIAGAGSLDRFVALIGSVACVPLVYVYPPYLHWKAGLARDPWAKGWDWFMMGLGMVGMVYTTTVTIAYSFL